MHGGQRPPSRSRQLAWLLPVALRAGNVDDCRSIERGKDALNDAPSLRDDSTLDRSDNGGEAEEERRCTHCRDRKAGEGGAKKKGAGGQEWVLKDGQAGPAAEEVREAF